MQVSQNIADTHHGHCLLGGLSVQTMVSSGYKDETAAGEDIIGDLANSLPLETLCRGATVRS